MQNSLVVRILRFPFQSLETSTVHRDPRREHIDRPEAGPPPIPFPVPGSSQSHLQAQGGATAELQAWGGGLQGEWSPPLMAMHTLPGRACRLESPRMVFTTQLAAINYSRPRFPTNSGTVTVSKIISGLHPTAPLAAARRPAVYSLPSPKTSEAHPISGRRDR